MKHIIIRRDDPLIFETAPLLLRSSPCEVPEARVDLYQYNNIMLTARTQAWSGLGRTFCEPESVFLRPHHRHHGRHQRDSVRQSFLYYSASGSDRGLNERERYRYLLLVYAHNNNKNISRWLQLTFLTSLKFPRKLHRELLYIDKISKIKLIRIKI